MIIDFFSKNGVILTEMLFEEPFTSFHTEGILGLFDEKIMMKLLSILKHIGSNAVA